MLPPPILQWRYFITASPSHNHRAMVFARACKLFSAGAAAAAMSVNLDANSPRATMRHCS